MKALSLLCISLFLCSALCATPDFSDLQSVVLAAGKSSRFNKEIEETKKRTKMLAPLGQKQVVLHALAPMQELGIGTTLVVGYQKEMIKQAIKDAGYKNVQYVHQKQTLGTGHAVACTQNTWAKNHIMITYGDMPLINTQLIKKLYEVHIQKNADLTFVVAQNVDPKNSYGRLVQTKSGIKIVEKKHFTFDIHDYPLVNAGVYLVKREVLKQCLPAIEKNEKSGEYYLTDIIELANKKKLRIATVEVPYDVVRGINTQQDYHVIQKLIDTAS